MGSYYSKVGLNYEDIQFIKKYYVISDIHGDLSLFIKFLVGVYNDLSGNEYYIEDKPFHYFNLSKEIIKTIQTKKAIIYDCDTFFKIMDKNQGKQIVYETFIKNLNDLLKRYKSCIVLNGDTFNNHFKLNETNQPPFDYLKNFNKYSNKLSYLNQTPAINNELISRLIEISIIYDSIKILNSNLLFIVGNHELYLLANDNNNKYAIDNCHRVKNILVRQLCGGDEKIPRHNSTIIKTATGQQNSNTEQQKLTTDRSKKNQDVSREQIIINKQQNKIDTNKTDTNKTEDTIETLTIDIDMNKTLLIDLQDFILDYGYVELITDKLHIQHAPNTINYLGKNKCNINTKLIDVLCRFKCFNIVDILKNKISNVDVYNKLCNESIYKNNIYGHTSNEKILRCDSTAHKDYYATKFFIDRQYSIYEIIKNININYDELLKLDRNGKQKLSNDIIENIKTILNSDEPINNRICGLIYYYCIKNNFILLYDRTKETIINKNYSMFHVNQKNAINDCIKIRNLLLDRNCDIYYLNTTNYTTTNMYIAQIFSLCYRFKSMYAITEQKNETQQEQRGYKLFEQINPTYLICDVEESDENMITQRIF